MRTKADQDAANVIAAKAREIIKGNPKLEAGMRLAWAGVEVRLDERIRQSGKKWKVYEAHHMFAVAREAMLSAMVDGKTPEECAAEAIARVTQ